MLDALQLLYFIGGVAFTVTAVTFMIFQLIGLIKEL